MANKSSYYYLKIKENFFDTEDMKLLESMENGYLYSNILMKMYLLSLKNGGKLMYKDKIPYNSKMLSTILNHNIDILDKAIQIFKELNLIEVMDTGAIFMIDIQNFIGKSSDEADRIRAFRSRIETEKQLENKSDVQMYDKCTTDVANTKDRVITRVKDKDITRDIDRVKDITRNINNTPNTLTSITPKNEIKKNYGKYQRVKLSDNEVKKLIEDFGKEIVKEKINQIDEYVEINNNKNKYKNFNLVIRKAIKENWFDKKSSSKEYKSEFMKGIEKYASDDFEPNLNILPEFRKEDYE